MTISTDILKMSETINSKTANALCKTHKEIIAQRNALQKSAQSNGSNDSKVLLHFDALLLNVEKAFEPTLKSYANSHTVGSWSMSHIGIGPVTAARLLSQIEITSSRTPEHIWSYAGLVPKTANDGHSYNTNFKDTCIDLAKSFVKYSSKNNCFYGQLYLKERERRIEMNKNGEFSDLAQESLATLNQKDKRYLSDKAIYETGKIPLDRIESQAQRYAVKIFLAHWHAVAYYEVFGVEYKTHHKNIIPVPNWPF